MMNCRNIKCRFCLVLVLFCIATLCSCNSSCNIGNPVLPSDYTDKLEFNDENDFTKTSLSIYYYKDSSAFDGNPNFEKVGDRKEEIKKYFQNFFSWLEAKERTDELTFNYDDISPDDYVAVSDMAGQKSEQDYTYQQYENYNLMLFDVSENTLYNVSNYY